MTLLSGMSGGKLVVLDRQGRDGKQFPLPSGLATLGSDAGCDIRVLLPTICPHHATVVVHANQVCLCYYNCIAFNICTTLAMVNFS